MAEHKALISWERSGPDFAKGSYSRDHTWTFDGGVTVPASAVPSVVPSAWASATHVDPEEAFVASVASCHMLTFVWLASRGGFQVDRYHDEAVGVMAKNERGVPWVSTITLHPRIEWGGGHVPSVQELDDLHHRAHDQCYISNSITTEVIVKQPVESSRT